jgi:phospholipid/cholesterol/gamma-HCH transport system ATP-binding protein
MIRDLVMMKLMPSGCAVRPLMPSELSGGMARRVALARAMALDPMLMMYDEPFAGLDPISLGRDRAAHPTPQRCAGRQSIMVTHDVHESLQIVDYLYFVSEGRMVAEGTPDEIVRRPIPSCISSSAPRSTGRCRSTFRATTTAGSDGEPA